MTAPATKIVVNARYGGSYWLSPAALDWLHTHGGDTRHENLAYDRDRANPLLVACIEALGDAASDQHCHLVIIEVPADITWHVVTAETGYEWVAEDHRTWQPPPA